MKPVLTCDKCNKKSLNLVKRPYTCEVKHDGRPYSVTIPSLDYYACDTCHSQILPDEADCKVGIELRRVAKLLLPEEIKRERKRLGWTQKQLADLLSVAEATVCRWETGGQIQQHSHDRTLRAVFQYDDVRRAYQEFAGWKQPNDEDSATIAEGILIGVAKTPVWVSPRKGRGDAFELWSEVIIYESESTYDEDVLAESVPTNRVSRYFCCAR